MSHSGYEGSLRSKPFVRPQPLRRGQGVGGGNYQKLSTGNLVRDPSRASPTRCNTPAANPSGRTPSKSGPRQGGPCEETPQAGPSGLCQAGPSRAVSPTGRSGSQTAPPKSRTGTKGKTVARRKTGDGCPETKPPTRPSSANRPPTRPGSANRPPPTRPGSANRPTPTRTSTVTRRPPPTRTPTANRPPPTRPSSTQGRPGSAGAQGSPRPGPSGVRPPTRGGPSGGPRGPAPCPEPCPGPSQAGPQVAVEQGPPCSPPRPVQGPCLYPIVPGQYETPFVSLPGPRQVLLMPGDINPNETTIIDIVGLDEGNIEEVPGIPPHAPKTILLEGKKKARADHAKWLKRLPNLYDTKEDKKKRPSPPKKDKKERKGPTFTGLFEPNMVFQGRCFPYEQYGNVGWDEPPYEGPPRDPECQRARQFSTRKTLVRPQTDQEIRELEELRNQEAIRAIIAANDERLERERRERGLGDNDLMDVDVDNCEPLYEADMASPDIFYQTDPYWFGSPVKRASPQISPVRCPVTEQPPSPCDQNLIAWDQGEALPSTRPCDDDVDFLTRTPPQRCSPDPCARSPNLMVNCDPDYDLLNLRSPPKRRSPSPCANEEDDLIRWNAPVGIPLPFDEQCEQDIFEKVCANNRQGRFSSSPGTSGSCPVPRRRSGQVDCQPCPEEEKLIDLSTSPCGDTRIVRAVPLEGDPTTAVLEDSVLAQRNSFRSPNNTCEESGDDSSLGIIDFGANSCLNDDFDRPCLPSPRVSTPANVSGVCPIDDEEDLDILDIEQMPDLNVSQGACQRFQEEGFLEQETFPCNNEFDELERRCEEEMDDLLHLHHQPLSPQERQFGHYGYELVRQCRDPIEHCDIVADLTNQGSPRRFGRFATELLEQCPYEQEIIDVNTPERPCSPKPYSFGYSKDLFTNIDWDPSMAPKPKSPNACRSP